jgi:hypothetical protein
MPIVFILNFLLVYLILCGIAGFFGRKRRIGFWGFFFLSIIVTPIITMLLIYFAAAPKHYRHRRPVTQRRG